MVRCLECGSWIWRNARVGEEFVCKVCGAILMRKSGIAGLFLRSLEVVGHTRDRYSEEVGLPQYEVDSRGRFWFYNQDRSLSEGPVTTEREPSLRGDKVKWGHCNHCKAVIMLSNAKFCSNCGAILRPGLRDLIPLEPQDKAKPVDHIGAPEYGDECMVCNLELNEDDDVVWCPYCGNPAHRTHLLEWLHVKNHCPMCGQHLTEHEIE